MIVKLIVGGISLLVLFLAFGIAAPGDDPVWKYIYSGLSLIALVLIALSFRDPMYNKIFYLFSGSVLAFFLIAPWIYNNFMR